MAQMDLFHQNGTPFDGFLYAGVGTDRGGNTVSVLSALARLGLDPWDEAADLSELPRDGARNRLGGLLARFGDVPALRLDHGATTQRLLDLLPNSSGRKAAASAQPGGAPAVAPGKGLIIAMLLVGLIVAYSLLLGGGGPGN